jgi:hypothetical protein
MQFFKIVCVLNALFQFLIGFSRFFLRKKQNMMLTAAPTTTTDEDDEGRQTQPCEATAFEQTPIADVGKPYRPQPNDSKPTKTETTSAGRSPTQMTSCHMLLHRGTHLRRGLLGC